MPRGTDTGNHPGRRVGRERYPAKQTHASRSGDIYSIKGEPGAGRPAFTMFNPGGDMTVATGGPAGPLVTQRGPSWSQPKTTRFQGAG